MADAHIGEHYRKIDGLGSVWEVVAINVDPNGIRHCRLVNVSDHTDIKAISEGTLTKRRFYRLYASAPPVHEQVE
jgi:hypothetical protein